MRVNVGHLDRPQAVAATTHGVFVGPRERAAPRSAGKNCVVSKCPPSSAEPDPVDETSSTAAQATPEGSQNGGPSVDRSDDSDSAYGRAIRFLHDRINFERVTAAGRKSPFKLDRMRVLIEELGIGEYLYSTTTKATTKAKAKAFGSGSLPGPTQSASSRPPVPMVHLAGTKGKGSTATMIASCLAASGYRTGLYTSPHLHRLEERFRVDMAPCSPPQLCRLVERITPVVTSMESRPIGAPTFFELTTAIAMLHFHDSQCEAIVIETGLGGRLDSTNVLWPTLSVITTIGLDHQELLGETVSEIAAEKAGILKPDVPLICGVTAAEPQRVIAAAAARVGAPLFQSGRDFAFDARPARAWGVDVFFGGFGGECDSRDAAPNALPLPIAPIAATLPVEGLHQGDNAALAIAACQWLRSDRGGMPNITDGAIRTGLAAVPTAGRVERFDLADGITGVVDTAHNPDSIDRLADCLRDRFGGRRVSIVFGTSSDKDAAEMLRALCPLADALVLTQFRNSPRFQPAEQLVAAVPPDYSGRVIVQPDAVQACEQAWTESIAGDGRPEPGAKNTVASTPGVIVSCGSFFLAAEVRPWMMDRTANAPP